MILDTIYNFLIYDSYMTQVKNHLNVICLLQVVLGIIQALTSEETSRLELLISFEKLILQNIAVSRDSTTVLGQVIVIFSCLHSQYQ